MWVIGTGAVSGYVKSILPVTGYRKPDDFEDIRDVLAIAALSDPYKRYKCNRQLMEQGCSILQAVHEKALFNSIRRPGQGAIINAFTYFGNRVKIFDSCLIHTGVKIEHDTIIGSFCNIGINCSIAGRVRIGCFSIIHTGAVIGPGMKIGHGCVIGANALVLDDVPDFSVVYGQKGSVQKSGLSGE